MVEDVRGSQWLYWPLLSSVVKTAAGCSTEQTTGESSPVASTVSCPSSVFLAISPCLSFISLWVG